MAGWYNFHSNATRQARARSAQIQLAKGKRREHPRFIVSGFGSVLVVRGNFYRRMYEHVTPSSFARLAKIADVANTKE